MNEIDQTGLTLLDQAKAAIDTSVETLGDDINIGLRRFGPETTPHSSDLCLNTDLVLEFTPRSTAPYHDALQSISATGTAALLSAIRQGIGDITTSLPGRRPVPNPPPGIDPYQLIVYTGVSGGLEQCAAFTLQEMSSVIKQEAEAHDINMTIYLIASVADDEEARDLSQMSDYLYRSTGIAFWPYPVRTGGRSLSQLLDLILRLSSTDVLEAYQASLDLGLNVEATLTARIAYEGAIGEYDAALSDLDRLNAEFPDTAATPEYWYLRGITFANLTSPKWQESAAAFASATALDDGFAPAYYGHGVALANLGQLAAARSSFARAYDLDSDFPQFGDSTAPEFLSSETLFAPDLSLVNPFFHSNPNFYYIALFP
jgi:hypothetical protein